MTTPVRDTVEVPRDPSPEWPAVRARGLVKHYGASRVLDDVELTVAPGGIVAIVGPNGAGKSTLLRIIGGLVIPDRGTVEVCGEELAGRRDGSIHPDVGLVLGEDRSFFWRMTGRHNLEFFAALHGLRRRDARARAEVALSTVGLEPAASQRVDRYSTGMRARLGMARALLGQPAVLLLDEPTRSLDPVSAASIRELLVDVAARRATAVVLVTHDLEEAIEVASHVNVLVDGRIVRCLRRPVSAGEVEDAMRVAMR